MFGAYFDDDLHNCGFLCGLFPCNCVLHLSLAQTTHQIHLSPMKSTSPRKESAIVHAKTYTVAPIPPLDNHTCTCHRRTSHGNSHIQQLQHSTVQLISKNTSISHDHLNHLNHTAWISFQKNSDDRVWPKKCSALACSWPLPTPEVKVTSNDFNPPSLLLMAPVSLRTE